MKREPSQKAAGFTLLEIVLVLFVLGTLAAWLVPSVRETIEGSRRDAEMRTVREITSTITASFENTDLSNLNVAALSGTIGTGDVATGFSGATSGSYASTNSNDWFVKVARLRGQSPQVGVAPAAQPELARVCTNPMGNMRLLFVGPSESGRQRFLLVSLMARSDQLQLPPYENTSAWFDAIWNQDWESRTASVPAYWNGRLSPAALSAWTSGNGGTTQASKLCVQRIVLPKYRVTVNNNHPTDAAFISFNNLANAVTATAASGVTTTPEILGGRLIIINRGMAWPGTEVLRFTLRENPTVTLQ